MSIMALMRDGVDYVGLNKLSSIPDDDMPDYDTALNSSDSDKWLGAMDAELDNIENHGTWKPAVLPSGRKMIDCKWVFRIKRDYSKGKVKSIKYKARLVIKGFKQLFGIDYFETFAPTVRADTWRTVYAIAAEFGPTAILFQWDVVGAYLFADLDEEIYMRAPPGCNLPKGFNCLRLLKALYGLKQAGRCWYKLLLSVLIPEGFISAEEDACLFIHHGPNGEITLLCLFVDDLFGFSNERAFLMKVKARLDDVFDLKDAGDPEYVLGIHIERNKTTGSIKLHQEKYIANMLDKFNMTTCHTVRTPADPAVILCVDDGSTLLTKDIPYREAVGALLFAAVMTVPNIAYAVSRVAKFVETPRESHWTAVKRIFRYLKGNMDKGICFEKTDGKPLIEMYCDADYTTDVL